MSTPSAPYGDLPVPPAAGVEVVNSLSPIRARVSWSAIFAGVVLVIAIEVLLAVLGLGIGLGLVSPKTGTTPDASGFGMGAGLWWLISMVIAMVAGSYAAARLANAPTRFDGMLHGLVIWGLALLLTVYLVTSAVGGLIGGAFSVVGGAISAAGSAVGGTASAAGAGIRNALPQIEQATGLTPDIMQQQAESLLAEPAPQEPANMNRGDAVKAIGQALSDLLAGGDRAAAAKQRITEIVAAQAHISREEAQKRVDDTLAKLTNLKEQAAQTARDAANAGAGVASHGSFLAFIGLLIGAAAAAIGGGLASPVSPWWPPDWSSGLVRRR